MALTAGTWRNTDQVIGAQGISEVSSTARHPLGTIIRAKDAGTTAYGAGEFMYVKGVASGATGAWVTINDDDYSTALLAANAIGPVGVMMADLVASTYGWVQISGKAIGACLTGFADNGKVYATATAGSIDDASVAGDLVINAKGASGIDTLQAEFEISRPFVADVFP